MRHYPGSTAKAFVALLVSFLCACSSLEGPLSYSPNTVVPSAPLDVPDLSADSSPATTLPRSEDGKQISWVPCTGGDTLCATLKVPYSYTEDVSGYFTLSLRMRKASKEASGGYLLVNPGGPGFGGTGMLNYPDYYFSSDILDNFDIVAWDPRGTGDSTPFVDCVDSFDRYFAVDMSPDTPAERKGLVAAAEEFNAGCVERSGEILPYVSTINSARDMDSIRRALGVDKISYFGFSYGSELGAVWATLYPETVRAAVLDGASDPLAGSLAKTAAQAAGFEMQLEKFLDYCSNNPVCPFNNGMRSAQALDELFVRANSSPVDTARVPITDGVLFTGIAVALYSDRMWDLLAEALFDLQMGDGSAILSLYDDYFQYDHREGVYGNELEAFLAISCIDDRGPASVALVDANLPMFNEIAPRLGYGFAYGYFCALWPEEEKDEVAVSGVNAGPIVVVGTTGDAATPLESSARMAATLEGGVLVVVEADQHTGYKVNACINKVVDRYLLELVVPKSSTRCRS